MAHSSALVRLVRTPPQSPDALTPARERPTSPRQLAFVRVEPNPSGPRHHSFLRRVAGPIVGVLAVAAVCARHLISNHTVPSPSTDAEAVLGINAYANLASPELGVPGSLSDTATSWQVTVYSYLSSASERHEELVGTSREFVLVLTVLTALLTIAVCRRLLLGWISTATAVVLAGAPAAAALARIISAPATVAAFWLSVAALSVLVFADRKDGARTRGELGGAPW